jgi:hypothetical protein
MARSEGVTGRPSARAPRRTQAEVDAYFVEREARRRAEQDEFDRRILAALRSFDGREAYAVEVAERAGVRYPRAKLALARLEQRGQATSRRVPCTEHGGATGLPRRYFKPA